MDTLNGPASFTAEPTILNDRLREQIGRVDLLVAGHPVKVTAT